MGMLREKHLKFSAPLLSFENYVLGGAWNHESRGRRGHRLSIKTETVEKVKSRGRGASRLL